MEQLKQDICMMRKENGKLKGELKLFRYYFLHLWRDKQRYAILEKPELRQELIESAQNLYDAVEANGLTLEDFGSKTYYVTFTPNKADMLGQSSGATLGGGATPSALFQSQTPMGNNFAAGGTPTGSVGGNNMMVVSTANVEGINNLFGWY